MSRRAIIALGIGQCVSWGVLYYAFGALLIPIEKEMAVPRWVVAGAFSTGLFMSAVIAPGIGRLSDRGFAPQLLCGGGISAAVLLLLWAAVPGLPTLYVVWAALGLCMAATLYEPAFAIVGYASSDPRARLRALALVTVFGGLASTVFLPLTAVLANAWGWRATVGLLAGVLALSTLVTSGIVMRDVVTGGPAQVSQVSMTTRGTLPLDPRLRSALVLFPLATLASAAFTTTVVPALVERELPSTTSAMLGGLLGVMQLPGRAMVMHGGLAGSPSTLLVLSLLLQASGFGTLVFAQSVLPIGGGVVLFALGSGLMTLVRPHLVQTELRVDHVAYTNGLLARYQDFARAAGPVLAIGLASAVGFGAVFGLLACVMVALAVTWRRTNERFKHSHMEVIMSKRQESNSSEVATTPPRSACCESVVLSACCGAEQKPDCCGPREAPDVCACGGGTHAPGKG